MAFFSVMGAAETEALIYISPDSAYNYYRVYVRLTSDTSGVVFDQWIYAAEGYNVQVTGLLPGTSYTVNVAYNTTADATGSKWIGLQEFVTSGSSGTTYYAYLAYNANGGSGAPSTHLVSGNTETFYAQISNEIPTRSGYTFAGWWLYNKEEHGTYPAGGQVPITGTANSPNSTPHTLYAQWKKGTSVGSVRIGNTFAPHTPYIWNNGAWRKAVPYIWNGGWKKGT